MISTEDLLETFANSCCSDFRGRENILANYVLTNGSVAVGVDAVLWHDYIGMYTKTVSRKLKVIYSINLYIQFTHVGICFLRPDLKISVSHGHCPTHSSNCRT